MDQRRYRIDLPDRRPFPCPSPAGFPQGGLMSGYVANLLSISPLHTEFLELIFQQMDVASGIRVVLSAFSKTLSAPETEMIQKAEDEDDLTRCMYKLMQKHGASKVEKRFRAAAAEAILAERDESNTRPTRYQQRLCLLEETLGITTLGTQIVEFAVCYDANNSLMRYCDRYLASEWPALIATALNVPIPEVEQQLRGPQNLLEKGLIKIDENSIRIYEPLYHFLLGLRDDFLDRHLFTSAPPSPFPLESFPVESADLALMTDALRSNVPCHFLFYGRPGTGKTELAKALAQQSGRPAVLLSYGKTGNPKERKIAITAAVAQSTEKTLLIIDEADNLLNRPFFFNESSVDKSWINQFMDRSRHSVIWITNEHDGIPASILRRFSYSLPFKKFTHAQRKCAWEEQLQQQDFTQRVTPQMTERLARRYETDASAIASALTVTKNILRDQASSPARVEATLGSLLSHHARLSGMRQPGKRLKPVTKAYDPAVLHTDADPAAILRALQLRDSAVDADEQPPATLLFWGLPGTGKTEFAKYLAREMDKPLINKRMSDLQSKFVGETEQNIAAAFEEAEAEGGILLLDEADSLFLDRKSAQRSWESSQTNELLTQIENFEGICICCTNLLKRLDHAALRRFTWKIEFKPLTLEGRERLFRRYFQPRGRLSAAVREQLEGLWPLTPGDFKTVAQQIRMQEPPPTRLEIVQALKQEIAYKSEGQAEPIGFGAA